jgi:hypothetical protein
LAVATTVVYLAILHSEGDSLLNSYSVLLLAAGSIAAAGVVAASRPVLSVGAASLGLLGLLGLASIGLPLVVAAGLLFAASTKLG